MSAPLRIGAFALVVVAVFGIAAIAGAELDPSVRSTDDDGHEEGEEMEAHATQSHDTVGAALPGLAVATDGYRLVPSASILPSERAAPYTFHIAGPEDETVRDFDVEHERRMHLIVVGRDFTAFQHLHPRLGPDGTWAADLDLSRPGAYRVFADFSTGGEPMTLATDLLVAGEYDPRPLPAPSRVASAGNGYEVTLDQAGPEEGALRFTVSRHGDRVESVEPYLGADGHLVALREHDLAFLHTHPEGEPGGNEISFAVEYPTAGRYRLFLQFRHDGKVRTAEFTREVGLRAEATPRGNGARSDSHRGEPQPHGHEEEPHGH